MPGAQPTDLEVYRVTANLIGLDSHSDHFRPSFFFKREKIKKNQSLTSTFLLGVKVYKTIRPSYLWIGFLFVYHWFHHLPSIRTFSKNEKLSCTWRSRVIGWSNPKSYGEMVGAPGYEITLDLCAFLDLIPVEVRIYRASCRQPRCWDLVRFVIWRELLDFFAGKYELHPRKWMAGTPQNEGLIGFRWFSFANGWILRF